MTEDLKIPVTDDELPNDGPRVKPNAIEGEIASEHYFTANAGVYGMAAFASDGSLSVEDVDYNAPGSLKLLTLCILVLQNGFTIVGKSACASPENFRADIGMRIAREDAVSQIGPFLGFRLRDQLSRPALTEAAAAADLAGLPRPDASGPVSA